MVTIRLNITPVTKLIQGKLDKLRDKEYLLRPVAFDIIGIMKHRIHIEGKASDGNTIGSYSKSYMSRRKKFNRGKSQSPVIVSLTRQLENNYAVIATERGYAIGFTNPYNLKKARWVEAIKKKIIFNLTKEEDQYARDKLDKLVKEAFGS